MKIYWRTLAIGLLGCLAASSLQAEFTLDVGPSYRQDRFDWNIAGGGNNPNILSELTWTDLQIFQITGRSTLTIPCGLYLRANADYGWIYHGNNQDSDYAGDNRTLEFSRSNNRADQGNVYDAEIGGGKCFYFCCGTFWLAPIAGYSVHGQNLHMTNGVQTLSFDPSQLGPFDCLNNTYDAIWHGPWIGVDLNYQVSPRLTWWGSAEYHRVRYHGSGHWNLRDDILGNFIQDAYGNGFVAAGGLQYWIYDNCSVGVMANYQYWQTDCGRDRATYLDPILDSNDQVIGTFPVTADTRLNEVNWRSWSVALDLGFVW